MKTIVFTQRVEIIEHYNERRDCADQRIAEYIMSCGFLPLPVPNNASIARHMIEAVNPDGIVLTGGNSLVKYGGNAPERDETDRTLIEIGIERKLPIYGFCRGMQSILDFFGNELRDVKGHVAIRHRIIGSEKEMTVNSYHNQACLELSNDQLVVVMRSEDEVIEKIRHKELPIIGTMWHPERETPFSPEDMYTIISLMGGKEQ